MQMSQKKQIIIQIFHLYYKICHKSLDLVAFRVKKLSFLQANNFRQFMCNVSRTTISRGPELYIYKELADKLKETAARMKLV